DDRRKRGPDSATPAGQSQALQDRRLVRHPGAHLDHEAARLVRADDEHAVQPRAVEDAQTAVHDGSRIEQPMVEQVTRDVRDAQHGYPERPPACVKARMADYWPRAWCPSSAGARATGNSRV